MLNLDSLYTINPIQTSDAWSLCNFIVANEERLKRYFPKTLEQNLTPNLSHIFVEKKTTQFKLKEEFLFTIKSIETEHLVGLIYIKELDWDKKQGEFAYCIGYPFKGKAVMTKAISTLSEYAFNNLGLEILQIVVHKSNTSSLAVAKNCNFSWIKTLHSEYTPPGETPLNMELYELYDEVK